MDARSIAATARNKGVLTPATDIDYDVSFDTTYKFDPELYKKRVYFGFGKAQPEKELVYGPNITAVSYTHLLCIWPLSVADHRTARLESFPAGQGRDR